MRKLLFLMGVAFFVSWIAGCGGGEKARKAESTMDAPEIHYARGKSLLAQEKLNEALFEFQQAKSLDPKYAPAYEGMGWVYLAQSNFEGARTAAKKSLDLDKHWVLARFILARLKAESKKYDDAVKMARKGLKEVPKSTVPDKKGASITGYLTLGDIFRNADRYNEAQDAYSRVLEIDKTNMQADRAIRDLAQYKTAIAGQSAILQKVARQKQITRADVAVLFVLELPLEKVFRKAGNPGAAEFRPPQTPVMGKRQTPRQNSLGRDVPDNFWARSFIEESINRGIMEVYPDGTFRPQEPVNRAELARIIEKFLIRIWNDPGLESRYYGSTSPFSDVNNTAPIFNAVMVVASRNIIPGKEDGTFQPFGSISGTEAINIVRNLKAKL